MLTAYVRRGLTLAVGLGVGVGLMAGAVFVAAKGDGGLTDAEVIARARTLGMIDATELPKPAPAPAPAQEPAVTKVAVVPVPEGASFGEVAATLKAVGLIKEVDPFLARVSARKAAAALKVGVHQVPMTGLTDDQLIDLLTSLPPS